MAGVSATGPSPHARFVAGAMAIACTTGADPRATCGERALVSRPMKSFTYLRRAADVEPHEFAARWRDLALARHGVHSPPERPHRIAHCLVRPSRRPAEHDAIAVNWFADDAASAAWLAAEECADGSGLVDPSASTTIRVDERFVHGGDELAAWRAALDGTKRLLLLVRIEAAPGTTRSAYRDYWWDVHRPFANTQIVDEYETEWYVHNYVRADDPSRWAGIAEMYDRSIDVARQRAAWMETDEAAALRDDERRFLDRETRAATVTDITMVLDETASA
jgi:hypothetical protein